jgi:toxin-antitoxin system PIN domain toxin
VRILDTNLLIYATNSASPRHARAKEWLETALSDSEPVALPWVVILGFLRITTSRRVLPRPLTSKQAIDVVDALLSRPNVEPMDAGPDHWSALRELLEESGTAGNLTTDAHLAALAVESGATSCSTDADFARFSRLKWENPLHG